MHRDLKPENIFLARNGGERATVKILDFGIAMLSAGDALASESGRWLETQPGATLGTPCYMAPEQAVGEKDLDHRVDVWALAVILYECLSGIRPIDGETVGQVVVRLMSTGITPLEHVVLGLPEEVPALVGRMLARERGRRPDDLREVAQLLSRYTRVEVPEFGAPGTDLERSSPSNMEAEHVTILEAPAEAHGSRVFRPIWIAAAVGTVVLGVGAWAMRGSGGSEVATDPAVAATIRSRPAETVPSRTAVPSADVPPLASQSASVPARPERAAKRTRRQPRPSEEPSPPPAAGVPKAPRGLAETPPF